MFLCIHFSDRRRATSQTTVCRGVGYDAFQSRRGDQVGRKSISRCGAASQDSAISAQFARGVYRVAHNTAATHVRKQKRAGASRLISLEELDDLPGESNAERSLDESVVLARLTSLIQRLKPIDRDVMLLYLEGTSAVAIGDVTGLSPANVAQKIHRTKKVLQRHF